MSSFKLLSESMKTRVFSCKKTEKNKKTVLVHSRKSGFLKTEKIIERRTENNQNRYALKKLRRKDDGSAIGKERVIRQVIQNGGKLIEQEKNAWLWISQDGHSDGPYANADIAADSYMIAYKQRLREINKL